MSNFKVGDKVVCVNDEHIYHLQVGEEFTVGKVYNGGLLIMLSEKENPNNMYDSNRFKLVKPKYKHDAIVRAWLDGEEIEYFNRNISEWTGVGNDLETATTLPCFYTYYEYRIKPKKTERQLKIEEELEQKLQELKAMED